MSPANGYDHSHSGLGWAVELLRTDIHRTTDLQLASIEQGRRTEVLQREIKDMHREIMSTLTSMPERLARALPAQPAPPASPPPALRRLSLTDLCTLALGALVLVGVVAGKLTWSEGLPLIRSLIGDL